MAASSDRYTFRSDDDKVTITEIATSEIEAFALMAFTAERRHGLPADNFELRDVAPPRYLTPA